MKRYCVNCGSEVEGNFCPNCGTKVENGDINNQVFVNDSNGSIVSEKNDKYNLYKSITGGIMLFLGFCVFVVSFSEEQTRLYEIAGYSIMMIFTLPGLLTLVGGSLSIASKKNNQLFLFSGISYIAAAAFNLIGLSDISILFILCCVFGILNIVFYSKTR